MRWSGSRVVFWGIVLAGFGLGLIMLRVALSPAKASPDNASVANQGVLAEGAACCLLTPRSKPSPLPLPTKQPTAAMPDVSLAPSLIISQVVTATVETEPVPSAGDAAADPAIWVHPTDPAQSTILATDKKSGLIVYDLSGHQIQYVQDGPMNNVDVRYNFPLGGQRVALVAATNRAENSIAVYRVNPTTRQLENVAARPLAVKISAYGACMYRSRATGRYYLFVDSAKGQVEQWELFDNGQGQVDGQLVRAFDVGAPTAGCVADDELAYFYISEQATGIWKYGAEPEAGTNRSRVDVVRPGGPLTTDVEGLAIYYASNRTGYLIASSQGSDEFVVYRREGKNPYVMTFAIGKGGGIDHVSKSDGIEVTNFNLGPDFPQGMFVAQDGHDDNGNQNFKLVSWPVIAEAMIPMLTIDTTRDPRQDPVTR
jgi:3-phytase